MCSTPKATSICKDGQTGKIYSRGKWDTAVGGHIDYGETPAEALCREVREELGITDFIPVSVDKYVFESKRERELVYVNRTVYDGEIQPSTEELDGGRFWTIQEIREALAAHLGLNPQYTMAFGDGGNDISMIKAAGIGIAMGNALESLKREADYTTTGVDDDGVLNALRHFSLI